MKNYYDILGVKKTSSKEEIKQAFRKLAIENHPDKGGKKEKFQEIQEAYEILGNEEKRREYDEGPRLGPNMSNFDFFFNASNMHRSQKIKKANHFYVCDISLRDVHFGTIKKIKVKRENYCGDCYKKCDECDGMGEISRTIQMGPFIQQINRPCNKCNNLGIEIKNSNFENCNKKCQNGKIVEEKIFELEITKGIQQSKQFIFSGWGEQGIKENDISGDLIITINIKPDEILKKNDLNLIFETTFTLKESIIGKDIEINIFDEIININSKVFGILNPNKQYIIYKKGLNGENKRGDLYIIPKIEYPDKTLTDDEIKKLNNIFSEINL